MNGDKHTCGESVTRRVVVACTPAMSPAIGMGARIVVAGGWYAAHEVDRFDIVIAQFPDDRAVVGVRPAQVLLRVVGLPSETIAVRAGRVHINGSVLGEPYQRIECRRGCDEGRCCEFAAVRIPDSCYFLMGDNRPNCLDSRYFASDAFPRPHLVARTLQVLA